MVHEEFDVLYAYHMINEAMAGYSPKGTNGMPHSVKLLFESYSRSWTVIDVNEVVKVQAKIVPNSHCSACIDRL